MKVTVKPGNIKKFTVIDENYEPGWPVGDGDTVEEAIADYVENANDFYNEKIENLTIEIIDLSN